MKHLLQSFKGGWRTFSRSLAVILSRRRSVESAAGPPWPNQLLRLTLPANRHRLTWRHRQKQRSQCGAAATWRLLSSRSCARRNLVPATCSRGCGSGSAGAEFSLTPLVSPREGLQTGEETEARTRSRVFYWADTQRGAFAESKTRIQSFTSAGGSEVRCLRRPSGVPVRHQLDW